MYKILCIPCYMFLKMSGIKMILTLTGVGAFYVSVSNDFMSKSKKAKM